MWTLGVKVFDDSLQSGFCHCLGIRSLPAGFNAAQSMAVVVYAIFRPPLSCCKMQALDGECAPDRHGIIPA